MRANMMIDHGSWSPIFRHNHHGFLLFLLNIQNCRQLPDTIMPGERAAHPAPTLVMKDLGHLVIQKMARTRNLQLCRKIGYP